MSPTARRRTRYLVLAAALQWAFQRFRVSEFNSLLISFGVLIMLVQTISNVWTADFRRLVRPFSDFLGGLTAEGTESAEKGQRI